MQFTARRCELRPRNLHLWLREYGSTDGATVCDKILCSTEKNWVLKRWQCCLSVTASTASAVRRFCSGMLNLQRIWSSRRLYHLTVDVRPVSKLRLPPTQSQPSFERITIYLYGISNCRFISPKKTLHRNLRNDLGIPRGYLFLRPHICGGHEVLMKPVCSNAAEIQPLIESMLGYPFRNVDHPSIPHIHSVSIKQRRRWLVNIAMQFTARWRELRPRNLHLWLREYESADGATVCDKILC